MYKSHVSNTGSLARQGQLQGVLEGQGDDNKLQLQDELFTVELSCPTSQLRQSDSNFQL